jgi:hypothetical protein
MVIEIQSGRQTRVGISGGEQIENVVDGLRGGGGGHRKRRRESNRERPAGKESMSAASDK